jgi:tetratricopeptide (TPR) repeat protein
MIEEQIDRALEADPLNSFLHINFAGMCFVAGMRERALLEVLKAMDINENFWMCHLGMGSLDLIRGRLAEAVSAFERAHEFAPWNPQVIGHLAGALTRIGDHDRAETIIRRMKDVPPYSVPSGMVVYHCLASRSEAAADCLEEAIGRRDPMALIYFRNPLTVALQRSNRWTRLGELMNLPGAVISRDDAANW